MAHGVREAPDVNAVATRDDKRRQHSRSGTTMTTTSRARGRDRGRDRRPAGHRLSLRHYRMDEDHGNAYAVWQAMGSPQSIEPDARRRLEQAGKLALIAQETIGPTGGELRRSVNLPRQGVSLLRLAW